MAKKVLVLGAGMVSGPCVDYLVRHEHDVTVVSAIQDELTTISTAYPNVKVVKQDVTQSSSELQELCGQHDLVISLIPAHLLPVVIKSCLETRRNLIHASYVDDNIRAAHESAVAAGITILSEMGLDPGIDHMLAMHCIDNIREAGGQVNAYFSMCGGMPATKFSHGPLRYKFSWYPKGMFISAMKEAKYIKDGKEVNIPSGHIFDQPKPVDDILCGVEFEDIPNRDATGYRETYNIPTAHTVYRGTLRHKGFCAQIRALISLGLVGPEVLPELGPDSPSITWRELLCLLLKLPPTSTEEEIKSSLHDKHGLDASQMESLDGLKLLNDTPVPKLGTLVDALCAHLTPLLAYGAEEKDMILMRNIIRATMPDGQQQEHVSDLVEVGQAKGYSAMARTVGLTVAISACVFMKGNIQRKGVILPVTSDIYEPVLAGLTKEGIEIKARLKRVDQ